MINQIARLLARRGEVDPDKRSIDFALKQVCWLNNAATRYVNSLSGRELTGLYREIAYKVRQL